MAHNRKYQIEVTPYGPEKAPQLIEVEAISDGAAKQRASSKMPGKNKIISVTNLTTGQVDTREFFVHETIEGTTRHQNHESVEAKSADEAVALYKERHPDIDPEKIRSTYSTREVDSERAMELLKANKGVADPEAFLKANGFEVEFKEISHDDPYGGSHSGPEYVEFADGSIMDENFEHDYSEVSDYESDLGEAAHERLIQDFHAGDSGFKDPPSQSTYIKAWEQKQELTRPHLSSPAQAPVASPAPEQDSPGQDRSI